MNLLSFSSLINHLIRVKKKKKKVYSCAHCGRPWSEDYLALLYYKVDMEKLSKLILIQNDCTIIGRNDRQAIVES